MSTRTVTLDERQADLYGSDDDRDVHDLMAELTRAYGPVDPAGTVEVVHPDGFIVNRFEGGGN